MAEKLQRYLAEAGDQINSLTAENDKLRGNRILFRHSVKNLDVISTYRRTKNCQC